MGKKNILMMRLLAGSKYLAIERGNAHIFRKKTIFFDLCARKKQIKFTCPFKGTRCAYILPSIYII